MNVVYDNIVYDLQNFGGISTYWYELTQRMLRQNDVKISFFETGINTNNGLRKELNIAGNQIQISKRSSLFLERFLKLPLSEDVDIFHSSYFRLPKRTVKGGTVTTIHDFTHDLYYKGPRVWLHNLNKREAIRKSDMIITVSNNTKKDLLAFYPEINEANVKVIYNGVSEEFKLLQDSGKDSRRPYFLFIGSREHYKNFDFAVELARHHHDFDLFIVGSSLSKKELQYLEGFLQQRYKIFTGIDLIELNHLYNNAFCLLYPSSYEGFGIPLLEAMQAGCPFIALNASSIPEVAGDAGVLMNELSLDEGLQAIQTIMSDHKDIIAKGMRQVKKFSWNLCFEQTYSLYKELAR